MPFCNECADRVPELAAAARIEARRGLVEQQQARRTDETRTEVEAAAHAARIGASQPVGGFAEPDLLEHGGGARACRPPALAEQARDHLEVLSPAHRRLDRRELPGQPDLTPNGLRLAADVVAGHAQRPRVQSQQCRDGPHERGLAGPVRSEHGRHLAGLGNQVEAVERARLPVALLQRVCFDHRSHQASSSSCGWNASKISFSHSSLQVSRPACRSAITSRSHAAPRPGRRAGIPPRA